MKRNPPFKAVLFDKDGTLFDFQATWSKWIPHVLRIFTHGDRELARHVAAQLGFDSDAGEFLQDSPFVAGTPEVTIEVFIRQFPERSPSEIVRILAESSSAAEQVPAAPLQPLFEDLKRRNLRIGLVTNDREDGGEAHLRAAGCRGYFDFLAGSDSGYGAKPDPGMLLAFCSEFSIRPQDCLMVGDSPTDMVTGRNAGMTAIGVLTGVDSEESLTPLADAVLQDIGQIPDWLDSGFERRRGTAPR